MAESKNWYLVCYDIRDPKRWRKAYKLLQGYGESVQFSIFRCWLSQRELTSQRKLSREAPVGVGADFGSGG